MRSLLVAVFMLLGSRAAFAQEGWPRLEGGAGVAGCEQALAIGRAAFLSDAFAFGEVPPTPPPGGAIVLSVGDQGAYGPEGVVANAEVFTAMLPGPGEWARLHWGRTPREGLRLVIVDYPHSWRGYNYDVLAVSEALSPQDVRAGPGSGRRQGLGWTTWRPPIVVRDNTTGALAVISIDTGTLPDWPVFTQTAQGFEQSCTVRFRPEVENGAELLLPEPVRLLAQRIDATLGDGRNEGTLNSTGRIRFELSQVWANVALRPWALNSSRISPRPVIDSGLRRWSRQAPSFGAAYDALLAQYPPAQRALESHYERTFHLSHAQA
jgi:hypothetical protein